MSLQVLKGKIVGYQCKREAASFVFTDDDRNAMGVIAVAAAIAGLGGQAMATASNASATEEDADYLEFEIDGQPVKGWVWRSPFKEGDEVEVAAEWRGSHYELCAVARPEDRIVALYPHCSRGRSTHWRNAWKWWFLGTSLTLLIGVGFMELFAWTAYSESFVFDKFGLFMAKGLVAFFYPLFALMTWSLGHKWMPFVRLSERVFRAYGWERPLGIDLVKTTKRLRREFDDASLGTFYFRYARPDDFDLAKDSMVSISGQISQLTTTSDIDIDAYVTLLGSSKSGGQSQLIRRDSLPEVVTAEDLGPDPDADLEAAARSDKIEFWIGNIKLQGDLWRNPFREGDNVVVAAEKEGDHFRVWGVARPSDRLIALYPRCSGSTLPNLWHSLIVTGKIWLGVFCVAAIPTLLASDASLRPRAVGVVAAATFVLFAGFCYYFIYRDQLLPLARFAERTLRALNVPGARGLDLVESSRKQRTADDPGELGMFYFRY